MVHLDDTQCLKQTNKLANSIHHINQSINQSIVLFSDVGYKSGSHQADVNL